jgi:ssDNA-binding Zn-finger/Zn-ribbon topoisomerase 1
MARKQEQPIHKDAPGLVKCPKCGGPIGTHISKWGRYQQCRKYPKCDWRG